MNQNDVLQIIMEMIKDLIVQDFEETSIHLLYCQHQPSGNQLRIQRLIGAISAEAQCNPDDHELIRTYMTKLDWPGLTVDTIQELLRVISVVIEQYRTSARFCFTIYFFFFRLF